MKTFYKLKSLSSICMLVFALLLTTNAQAQVTIPLGNVTACDSWVSPIGSTITIAGFQGFGNTAGDTLWTVNLTINSSSSSTETVNECNSYTVPSGDTTFSVVGTHTYTDVIPNAEGCDSTISLTVNIATGITNISTGVNVSACDSYTAPSGAVYTTSGAFLDTVAGTNGCPEVTTYNLTITGATNSGLATEVSCGPYTAGSGNVYDSTGIYIDTIVGGNMSGCDSVVTINLTVNSGDEEIWTTNAISACDSYTMPGSGITYTLAGNANGVTDMDTVVTVGAAANGCNTIEYNTFTLAWTGVATSSDSTVTSCGSFTWGDSTWTASGTYSYPAGSNAVGCDSSVNVILTIDTYANANPIEDSSVYNGNNITVTQGFNPVAVNWITWNSCGPVTVASGAVVDSTVLGGLSGIYTDTVTDAAGCKTRYLYEVNIAASGTTNPDVFVTSNGACDSYTDENGTVYTANGLYPYVRANASNGCDETVNLTVSGLLSSSTGSIDVNACNDFTWNGTTYDSTGSYTQTFTNAVGCDSVHTLNLTIGSTTSSDFVTIPACDVFEYYDANYDTLTTSTAGVYTSHFVAANGCDSAMVVTLTVSPSATGTATYLGCDDVTYDGVVYTGDTTVFTTLTAANGCDSVVTVTININNATSAATSVITVCNSYTAGDGTVYTTSQTFTDNATNIYGCDSITLVTLTIVNTQATMSVTECSSEYITPSGDTLTAAGVYNDTLAGAGLNGCDSIMTITLSFGANTSTTDELSCDVAYTWNGVTYTSDSTVTWTGTNAAGCDSVATLNLTFGTASPATTNQVTSVGPWTDYDGNTIDSSGVYTYSYTNASGCDSIITVALTVDPLVNSVSDALANINIYPNPTSGNVTIDLAEFTNANIRVSNLIGEIVHEDYKVSTPTYNFAILQAAGVYFIEISNENNKEVFKLLVE